MKKILFRVLSLLLIPALLLPSLAACGAQGDVAIKYRDFEISTAIYQYLCCMDKTSFLYEANRTTSEKTAASQLTDVPAIWAMEDDSGKNLADTLKDGVTDKLRWMLYLEQFAKDQGYTLTEDDKAEIKNNLNTLVKNFETKSEFNKVMKDYGINYDGMYEYYLHQGLASIGNYMLFGENGVMAITDESAETFYRKNYITVGCIYINDQNKSYPNGKTVFLPEAEKAAKRELADEVYSRLVAGEDFTSLFRTYSDLVSANTQGDSFTFTTGGFGHEEVEKAAFALSPGSIERVDTDEGIFIIQRRGLNNAYFETEKEGIKTTLEEQKKAEILASEAAQFSLNEEYISSLSVADLIFVR